MKLDLQPVPLTQKGFAEYGEVIELENTQQISINQGLTTRFHDLFTIDTGDQGGKTLVNVFRTSAIDLPHRIETMEKHPLGSQAFIPMQDSPFLVLVASASSHPQIEDLTLFLTNGRQGINLRKNTWHHFNLVLKGVQDFLVVDRGGEGNNLVEVTLEQDAWLRHENIVSMY